MKDHSSHSHANKTSKESSLWFALLLTGSFLIAEVIGGLITGSLALLSDAAHMLTDVTALIISLVAIYVAKRPADKSRTYGYYRFEILAAAFNAALLFGVAFFILYEAYQRLKNPPEIYSMGMLVIALLGLVINIIAMKLLSHGKEGSLNLRSAYLEVWSDMISSLGVIIAAIVIYYTHITWVDSLVAVLIGLWVLPRTWILLKEAINILLEGVPEGVDIKNIETAILSVTGIIEIHDLHIWAITNDKISLTAHLVTNGEDEEAIRTAVQNILSSQFDITHTTLQTEKEKTLHCEVH